MANYIQSSILFQAYVHIDADFKQLEVKIEDADTSNAAGAVNAKKYLESYIDDRAKHFLDPSITTTLEFKSGSIKAYATVYGTLSSCLPPGYTDFAAAVNQLFWFTRRLSGAAVMELSFKTNTYLAGIERTEARPGIIGQTKRLIDELALLAVKTHDDAERERSRISHTKKLKRALFYTTRLLVVLNSEKDIELIKREISKLLRKVPSTLSSNSTDLGLSSLPYETHYQSMKNLIALDSSSSQG